MNKMGQIYSDERFTKVNLEKALIYFKSAVKCGYIPSLYYMSLLYMEIGEFNNWKRSITNFFNLYNVECEDIMGYAIEEYYCVKLNNDELLEFFPIFAEYDNMIISTIEKYFNFYKDAFDVMKSKSMEHARVADDIFSKKELEAVMSRILNGMSEFIMKYVEFKMDHTSDEEIVKDILQEAENRLSFIKKMSEEYKLRQEQG